MPEMSEVYDAMTSEAYKDGALDAKTTRLMAVCAALTSGCRGCILYRAKHALDQGAGVRRSWKPPPRPSAWAGP